MSNLEKIPNELDLDEGTCRAVIETLKGDRQKFAYDAKTKHFKLNYLLPEGMVFPFDFGFIPGTQAEDGDPLDILILMDAPAHVGCILDVRILGVINAKQVDDGKTVENDRVVGAAVHSYEYPDRRALKDLGSAFLSQLETFFVSYNKQRGKKFKITGTGGPKKALAFIRKAMRKRASALN